jgi:hypothetical protein
VINYAMHSFSSIDSVVRELPTLWLYDIFASHSKAQLVEITTFRFSYLFDLTCERLLVAYGISGGKNTSARPSTRMRGHPLGAGPLYHRGHAIPHTLGGGTDINLVPQLGRINIGPFRELEIRAVGEPGSFYFTYWYYSSHGQSQIPSGVDQGFMSASGPLMIRRHTN